MQKICPKCELPADFYPDASSADGLRRICIGCQKEANACKYQRHKVRMRAQNKANREKKVKFLWDFLKEHPCVDCGESDPVVLEFDHVRGEKRGKLSNLVSSVSLEDIKAEIAKCEVRCSNCHKRITAKRGGFYGYLTLAR